MYAGSLTSNGILALLLKMKNIIKSWPNTIREVHKVP